VALAPTDDSGFSFGLNRWRASCLRKARLSIIRRHISVRLDSLAIAADDLDARGRSPMCHQRPVPSLGGEAGGRSPGFICHQSTTPFQQLPQTGDVQSHAPGSEVERIFVISIRYQRCYSNYSACGIQWRCGPNLRRLGRLRPPLFHLTHAEHCCGLSRRDGHVGRRRRGRRTWPTINPHFAIFITDDACLTGGLG
jgi:hypothetical protein